MSNDIKALNLITDTVLAYKRGTKPSNAPAEKAQNTVVKNKADVETWSIPLQEIYGNNNLRLDASHYDQQTALALKELKKSGYPLIPLSDLATVDLPGQFARIWAKDSKHGTRYINASDLMSLMSIGAADERFLSQETNTNIDELLIRKGWLLLTCSGTIGRIFYVSEDMDGWVATHDLIRIIPNKGVPVGFLYAYLSSSVAQKQILGHTHGGQIDHVTHHQVREVLVPQFEEKAVAGIHAEAMQALDQRSKAISQLVGAVGSIQNTLNLKRKNAR